MSKLQTLTLHELVIKRLYTMGIYNYQNDKLFLIISLCTHILHLVISFLQENG